MLNSVLARCIGNHARCNAALLPQIVRQGGCSLPSCHHNLRLLKGHFVTFYLQASAFVVPATILRGEAQAPKKANDDQVKPLVFSQLHAPILVSGRSGKARYFSGPTFRWTASKASLFGVSASCRIIIRREIRRQLEETLEFEL